MKIRTEIEPVIREIEKVIAGKTEIIEKILMAILSGGNVLLDDVPGVGKTSLALAFGKVLGLSCKRIQFTPDVLPSDIVGFSIYNKEGERLRYVPGVINDCNILLADEINRTSSKTQSALLEAMEEHSVTVDGNTYELKNPFVVIATQNNVGTTGTQALPQAQLDRFLLSLTIGYPDKSTQMDILKGVVGADSIDKVKPIYDCNEFLALKEQIKTVNANEGILEYISDIAIESRSSELLKLGISPRGALGIINMAKSAAFIYGRDYIIPEDVDYVISDTVSHRLILSRASFNEKMSKKDVLERIMSKVKKPDMR